MSGLPDTLTSMSDAGLTVRNTFIDLEHLSPGGYGDAPATASAPAGLGGLARLLRNKPPPPSTNAPVAERSSDGSLDDDEIDPAPSSLLQNLPRPTAEEGENSEGSRSPLSEAADFAELRHHSGPPMGSPLGHLFRRDNLRCSSSEGPDIIQPSIAAGSHEPAYVVCRSYDQQMKDSEHYDDFMTLPKEVGLGELPVKNTFIDFGPANGRQPPDAPPTVSAPGALLSRLFKMRGGDRPDLPGESTPPTFSRGTHASVCSTASSDLPTIPPFNPSPPSFTPFPSGLLTTHAAVFADSGMPASLQPPDLSRHPICIDKPSPASAATEVPPTQLQGESHPMYLAHLSKECSPCNYFYYKADGCRQGSECQFCHLCPKGEIKKRKKEKVKMLKASNNVNNTELQR